MDAPGRQRRTDGGGRKPPQRRHKKAKRISKADITKLATPAFTASSVRAAKAANLSPTELLSRASAAAYKGTFYAPPSAPSGVRAGPGAISIVATATALRLRTAPRAIPPTTTEATGAAEAAEWDVATAAVLATVDARVRHQSLVFDHRERPTDIRQILAGVAPIQPPSMTAMGLGPNRDMQHTHAVLEGRVRRYAPPVTLDISAGGRRTRELRTARAVTPARGVCALAANEGPGAMSQAPPTTANAMAAILRAPADAVAAKNAHARAADLAWSELVAATTAADKTLVAAIGTDEEAL